MKRLLILLGLAAGLSSCGGGPEVVQEEEPNPFGPTGIPPALRGGGTPIESGRGLDELRNDAGTVWNADEIVYTDPDAEDPDAVLPELAELLAEAKDEGPWGQSYTATMREARRTETPVLMWFTDSLASPPSKAMSEDLFSRQDFEEWAGETFVRLQVDERVKGDGQDDYARKTDWVEALRKRYRVMGNPTLIVMTPSGEVIGRYRGYKRGQYEYRWGQLRQAAKLAKDSHEAWKSKMEKKGYRTWSDPQGRKFFAKLIAYKDGELVLVEPDGTRARTREGRLSVEDRKWIAEEKRKRGIE